MKQILEEAEKNGYAIGCINTPNVETLRAVIGAAEDVGVPVIIDHAQVHDPLIPIEDGGICEESKSTGMCAFRSWK